MKSNYFFSTTDEIIRYLFEKNKEISSVRLQKSLYLLYAYYGATYGRIEPHLTEIKEFYPKELFPATFCARRYGPLIEEVDQKDKNGDYENYKKLKKIYT